MIENIERCLDFIFEWEGGFVNHPKDPGKATNHGITIGTLSRYRGRRVSVQEVKDLTVEEAETIYKTLYWDKVYCDLWSPGLDLAVFDCAVNQGVGDARRFLQMAAHVTVDGIIGPITKKAVMEGNQRHILHEFLSRRMEDYGDLGSFKHFGLGWSRRLMATTMYATDMQSTR